MFNEINVWAVLAAALSVFFLGGIWYSKRVFGGIWNREAGMMAKDPKKTGHGPIVFVASFVLSLIAAVVFAIFLGPSPEIHDAIHTGFAAGLCWVATSFGINYLFAGRSLKLFLIDGGYHTVQFTLYGLILGLWH